MSVRQTVLHEVHRRFGARMVEFAGWSMPLQYTQISAEHLAVRRSVGVFDVSHMGEFWVRGPKALEFLQFATLNDVAKLKPGRAQYSMLPWETGGLVDDIYVYRAGEDAYLLVVNAANIDKDLAHLRGLAERYGAELEDASGRYALFAVQGPLAEEVMQRLTGLPLGQKRKNSTFEAGMAGKPVRLARTGYTGEDGFEVFVDPADAEEVWLALMSAGVTPVGLGARDTLRLEAGFPLYGHEFTDQTNPLCTAFSWVVRPYKDFNGKAAILAGECPRRLVGLVLERGIPREGYAVLSGGEEIGRVTSGTLSPLTKRGIAFAYLDAAFAEEGAGLSVLIRDRLQLAKVTTPPFFQRGALG